MVAMQRPEGVEVEKRAARGTQRLLGHLAGVERLLGEEREPVSLRLDRAAGPELARLLTRALVQGEQRARDVA